MGYADVLQCDPASVSLLPAGPAEPSQCVPSKESVPLLALKGGYESQNLTNTYKKESDFFERKLQDKEEGI